MSQARERFPDRPQEFLGGVDGGERLASYAWVAHARGDWPDALQRWRAVLKQFPNAREPRRRAAEALSELGRVGEALQVLEPALRMFPDDAEIALLHGSLVSRSRDIVEAERVWRGVRMRFPDHRDGYRGYAWALIDAGRLEDACDHLDEAVRRFPDDAEIAIDQAVAEAALAARQDRLRAIEVWQSLRARFPDHARGFIGLGQALREAGELDRSARVLEAAVSRFPDDPSAEVQLALTLSVQRRWPEAIRRWLSLKQNHPGSPEVKAGLAQVLDQARLDREAGIGEPFDIPDGLSAVLADHSESAQDIAALMNRFESLGNSCEVAMVQRLYGVNNLSLLRWAAIPPDKLILALNQDFDGVGDPQNTIIAIAEDEYTTEDTRYYMRGHTFTRASAEPIESFGPDQCRRIRWLRGKLLKSLRSATKVFVYVYEESLHPDGVLELHAALCRYSSAIVLLFVTLENADHPSGSVLQVKPGLFMGYIDRLSPVDISVDAWISLCRQVASSLPCQPNTEAPGE